VWTKPATVAWQTASGGGGTGMCAWCALPTWLRKQRSIQTDMFLSSINTRYAGWCEVTPSTPTNHTNAAEPYRSQPNSDNTALYVTQGLHFRSPQHTHAAEPYRRQPNSNSLQGLRVSLTTTLTHKKTPSIQQQQTNSCVTLTKKPPKHTNRPPPCSNTR
jgi:hypothetical protein